MDKFKNKHRISSIRLQNWDIGNNGTYFIFSYTANRNHFFYKIENEKLQLNEADKLVENIG